MRPHTNVVLQVATLMGLVLAISEVRADQAILCTVGSGDPAPQTLLIVGDLNSPTKLIWPSSDKTARTFAFTSISEAQYLAIEQNPETEDSASQIYINRLTGQLVLENYISHDARRALINACDGQITHDQCEREQQTIKGGNLFACPYGEASDKEECARWKNGSNLLAKFSYSCLPTQRKF